MATIDIDRLTLKLSGLSEREGQRLARLIAEGLAQADIPNTAPRRLETLRVNLTAPADGNVDRLSQQIVADVLRQLERTL
jgi:hypothetical protein